MGSNSLVSITIPFYNDEKYLGLSICSVICQTYQNWELLLIDDGSKDGSLQVAKCYEGIDNRIKVVSDGLNKGLACRLNESIKLARGKYYMRMDADDVMFPNRVEKQICSLEANPEIDVIGSSAIIIGEEGVILYGLRPQNRAPSNKRDVINGNYFVHPTVAGKTSWFLENPYDDKMRRSQDFFLWLSSVDHSRFAIIDEPLLFYRVINNDIWGKFKRDNRSMYHFFKSQVSTHNLYEPLKQCLRQQVRLPLFFLYYHIKGSDGVIKRRYRALSEEEKNRYTLVLNRINKMAYEKQNLLCNHGVDYD